MTQAQLDNPLRNSAFDVFVARQPIFQRDLQVYGYELLYRGNMENSFDGTPDDIATARVIANAFLAIGAEKMLNGKPAFLNFNSSLLTLEYAALVPMQSAIVEILERVEPTEEVLNCCRELKSKGYRLALDDSIDVASIEPWLDLVDIVKVDFLKSDERTRDKILARCKKRNIHVLAEKLETKQDFEQAAALGYEYYQGYFFARPTIVRGRAIPDAKLMLLQLLREVSQPEVDFDRVEKHMQRNVSLVYKLLRYVNSAAFGWRSKINSVRHAMGLLGESELRKWLCLLLVGALGQDTVPEVVVHSLVRARFAELVAPMIDLESRKASAFLLGLLSNLDSLLNCTMTEAISELNLDDELANALLGRSSDHDIFSELRDLMEAYEATDSARISGIAHEFHLSATDLTKAYVQAVEWADSVAKD
jgi:c-di-GMP-related signal transduction protein